MCYLLNAERYVSNDNKVLKTRDEMRPLIKVLHSMRQNVVPIPSLGGEIMANFRGTKRA